MGRMPDSVALDLPEEWNDIPLEEDEYRAFTETQIQQLKDTGDWKPAELRQVELLMALAFQAATQSRVMIASSYVAVEEAQSDDDEDIFLMASLIVSGFRRDEIGTDVPLRAELIAKVFAEGAPSDDRKARYDHIEPPSVCEVAGYKAAKLMRLMSLPTDPGQEFKQFTQSYLVSVADGDAVIVLQFSTINFEFAREFSELFERIAQTLRILYPDDPTFLDGEHPNGEQSGQTHSDDADRRSAE